MYCRNCRSNIESNVVICDSCGLHPKLYKKYCSKCGRCTNDREVMCIKCGENLTTTGKNYGQEMNKFSPLFLSNLINRLFFCLIFGTALNIIYQNLLYIF